MHGHSVKCNCPICSNFHFAQQHYFFPTKDQQDSIDLFRIMHGSKRKLMKLMLETREESIYDTEMIRIYCNEAPCGAD